MMPRPQHLRVWDGDRWRVCRLVRYARDGRRAAVRFFQRGRWMAPRYVALELTRPVGGGR
jgi:hypothetical protein